MSDREGCEKLKFNISFSAAKLLFCYAKPVNAICITSDIRKLQLVLFLTHGMNIKFLIPKINLALVRHSADDFYNIKKMVLLFHI